MSGTLRLEKLSVRRNGNTIVDDVSLTIDAGERVAIVGPNGAGKTTLMRCMAGMLPPTSGAVKLGDAPVGRMAVRERARNIAYVMQVHESPPPLTVRDFVVMARYAYLPTWGGYSCADEAQADESIATVKMTEFADRLMDTLSGGECQKVYLAAALAQDTPVLLLDEPATHLDYRHQQEMNDLIERIHAEVNKTIITVTHDLNAGFVHRSRIVAIADGKVAFDGSIDDLNTEKLETIYGIPFERIARADGTFASLPSGPAQ